jgi:hypothetical protein
MHNTHCFRKKVVPFYRWQPEHYEKQRNEDDGENIAMAEKVDYLKHASLVYPLNELAMSVFRVDDVGSLHSLWMKENIKMKFHEKLEDSRESRHEQKIDNFFKPKKAQAYGIIVFISEEIFPLNPTMVRLL